MKKNNTFILKASRLILKYKYESAALGGLLGCIIINSDDPLALLSGLVMIFGMFGMIAETICPKLNIKIISPKKIEMDSEANINDIVPN